MTHMKRKLTLLLMCLLLLGGAAMASSEEIETDASEEISEESRLVEVIYIPDTPMLLADFGTDSAVWSIMHVQMDERGCSTCTLTVTSTCEVFMSLLRLTAYKQTREIVALHSETAKTDMRLLYRISLATFGVQPLYVRCDVFTKRLNHDKLKATQISHVS